RAPRASPSFPTRRSSDLRQQAHLAPGELDDGAPRSAARVDVAQARAGVRVGGIDLQHLLEAGHGVAVLAQLLHPQGRDAPVEARSEEHTSELQSLAYLVC